MATFTITTEGFINSPPTQLGELTLPLGYSDVAGLTVANFTTETTPVYVDPEGDGLSKVKILSLTGTGALELNGTPVIVGDEIDVSDINAGNLAYAPNIVTTVDAVFDVGFDISDLGSNQFSGLTTGFLRFGIGAQTNDKPSQIGNREETIAYGDTLVFTRAMFTTLTTPAYVDPEGDAAGKLKITSLPVSGTISLNGVKVSVNQEIDFSDIDLGLLTYNGNLKTTAEVDSDFGFEIADVGSNEFTGTP